jgi:hypothetical protein
VQAKRQVERRGGGPERLVLGLVVAPVLERILGDHRAGEAQAGGALQLLDPVPDVVQVDHRDALESGGIRSSDGNFNNFYTVFGLVWLGVDRMSTIRTIKLSATKNVPVASKNGDPCN